MGQKLSVLQAQTKPILAMNKPFLEIYIIGESASHWLAVDEFLDPALIYKTGPHELQLVNKWVRAKLESNFDGHQFHLLQPPSEMADGRWFLPLEDPSYFSAPPKCTRTPLGTKERKEYSLRQLMMKVDSFGSEASYVRIHVFAETSSHFIIIDEEMTVKTINKAANQWQGPESLQVSRHSTIPQNN